MRHRTLALALATAALAMPAVGGRVEVLRRPERFDPPQGLGEWMSRKSRRTERRRGRRSNDARYVTKGIARSRSKEKARRQARAKARR